eukprot:6472467-Amphidinium_carterae.1
MPLGSPNTVCVFPGRTGHSASPRRHLDSGTFVHVGWQLRIRASSCNGFNTKAETDVIQANSSTLSPNC